MNLTHVLDERGDTRFALSVTVTEAVKSETTKGWVILQTNYPIREDIANPECLPRDLGAIGFLLVCAVDQNPQMCIDRS